MLCDINIGLFVNCSTVIVILIVIKHMCELIIIFGPIFNPDSNSAKAFIKAKDNIVSELNRLGGSAPKVDIKFK